MKPFLMIAGGGVLIYLAITGKAKPLIAGVFGSSGDSRQGGGASFK